MPIKNYTTSVSEARTVGEIMGLLAAKGARSIRIDYDAKARPSAVSFVLVLPDATVPFKLPCNFDGVRKALLADCKTWTTRKHYQGTGDELPKVRMIAWRIVKDWVAAQMALIEAEQASLAQVFLPYATYADGTTTYDKFMLSMTQANRQLESPKEEVVTA